MGRGYNLHPCETAVIIDLHPRKVVDWSFGELIMPNWYAIRSNRCCVAEVIQLVYHAYRPRKSVLLAFVSIIDSAIWAQMQTSGKGNCYENTTCEGFIHRLKVEFVYQQSFESSEQARSMIFWFVEVYYKRKRKHSTIGYKTPANLKLVNIKLAA